MPDGLHKILKAAGEPTRIRILNLLLRGSVCVCEMQQILGLPQPTVSRHLAALRNAGLVVDAREGARVIYSLAPADTPQLKALRQLLETCCPLEERLIRDLKVRSESLRPHSTHPAP
jgi:ArsR family transcriptional regulator